MYKHKPTVFFVIFKSNSKTKKKKEKIIVCPIRAISYSTAKYIAQYKIKHDPQYTNYYIDDIYTLR